MIGQKPLKLNNINNFTIAIAHRMKCGNPFDETI